jgi:hypothetical protein
MSLFQKQDSGSRVARQIKVYFNYLMIGMYSFLGLFLLIKGWYTLSKTQNIGIGILLVLYAIFRIYRVYHESRMEADDELPDK